MGTLKDIICSIGILYSILISHLIIGKKTLLYELTAFNAIERSVLYKLDVENKTVIFLNGVTNEGFFSMDVIIDDFVNETFETTLRMNNVEFSSINLGSIVNFDKNIIAGQKYINSIKFQEYNEKEEIINKIVRENRLLSKKVIASTYENANLIVLKLIRNPENPDVFIISGEQGRDWLSPSVLMSFLDKILRNESGIMELTEHYNFHFAPFANPDGYKYSMKQDRFWTKNRNMFFPQKLCWSEWAIGVNVDRNWFFGENNGDKCDSIYLGPRSLSEIESKAFAEYINTIAHKLMAFISLRGFGPRIITLPYGHTKEYSVNHNVMMAILRSAIKRVHKEHGVKYLYGQTSKYLYNLSGNSCDWVKKYLNVPIVYMVHLKSTDELFPSTKDIDPLSKQVTTIIKDTLNIGQNIYGPLFNKSNICVLATSVNILLLINCILSYY